MAVVDPLATKKKIPGQPDAVGTGVDAPLAGGNPNATTNGLDAPLAGGNPQATTNAVAAPIGDPPPLATTNAQPTSLPPPQATSLAPTSPPPPAAPATADPFAASGGGQYFADTGQWIPKNNTSAIAAANARTGAVQTPPGMVGDPQQLAPTSLPGAAETTTTAPAPYKDALLKMLGDSQTPASLSDPTLKAQSDAFSVGQTRSKERARSALAERNAQDGTAGVNSGAFNNDLVGLEQQQGEAESGYNAGLVGDAAKSKLAQMQSALSMMGNDINSEQGRALQKQIADTQAQIQREGMKQQASQFGTDAELRRLGITSQTDLGNRDLSLRDKLGTGGLNAQIMQMLMQNQQFGQGLASNNAQFGAGLNQQALLALLGGL